jgi:hypothetical protein
VRSIDGAKSTSADVIFEGPRLGQVDDAAHDDLAVRQGSGRLVTPAPYFKTSGFAYPWSDGAKETCALEVARSRGRNPSCRARSIRDRAPWPSGLAAEAVR